LFSVKLASLRRVTLVGRNFRAQVGNYMVRTARNRAFPSATRS